MSDVVNDCLLSYRANRAGTLHAVYRGAVRIGYLAQGTQRIAGGEQIQDWTWNLYLLRERGGGYMGRCPTLDEARMQCRRAVLEWVRSARLEVLP